MRDHSESTTSSSYGQGTRLWLWRKKRMHQNWYGHHSSVSHRDILGSSLYECARYGQRWSVDLWWFLLLAHISNSWQSIEELRTRPKTIDRIARLSSHLFSQSTWMDDHGLRLYVSRHHQCPNISSLYRTRNHSCDQQHESIDGRVWRRNARTICEGDWAMSNRAPHHLHGSDREGQIQ